MLPTRCAVSKPALSKYTSLIIFCSKNKNEYNQARREERAKGSKLCEECGHRVKNENWEAHFHYSLHPNSELNVLMKGYLKQLGDLRRQGKLNDKIQAEIKEEYEKQKR